MVTGCGMSTCGGTPVPGAAAPAPALVQVENAPGSEPHAGLQNADIVFEYLTEGGITRFTAVYFNPSSGAKIEPVRSARLVTIRLVQSFGGVLFYSGASSHVSGQIQSQSLHAFTESSDGGKYFARDSGREAPHNLYTTGDKLQQGVSSLGLHRSYSLWPTGSAPSGGHAVHSVSFDQTSAHHVNLAYTGGSYTYQSDQGYETDADQGGPVKIANVVLLQVAHHGAGYTEDVLGAEGIDFDLSGTGPATLYRDGMRYDIKWDLSNPNQPLKLVASGGGQVALHSGLTWVYLVDPGTSVQEG